MERKRGPMMGLNGFDRRSALYASQPEVYSANANDNYQVIMRAKKVAPPSYNNVMDNRNSNLIRIPQPPPEKEAVKMKAPLQAQNGNRFRPISSNSFGSISSGMAEVQWRNSRMSTSPSTISGESQHSSCGKAAYNEDQAPKVFMECTQHMLLVL
uniref:ZM domain-containing protein n=1 Tax=Steinernema glaseri TaxID=37863 RepID=A0A1I8AIY6_9BILA